ncbi:hypothetical protein RB195_022897 [Necator americanus]|uniref:Reverse transcriptase domain-containing protein n=1 Tax=Necator americanus TaxID=51031 RepID=A0ABR1EHX6_NECAM
MDNIDEEYDQLVEQFHEEGSEEAINEDFEERKAEVLTKAAEAEKSLRYARNSANRKTKMAALRNPEETSIALRRGMEKIIHDFYSDLFDSHVHLPPHHLREDGQVIPEVLPPRIRHAIMAVRNRTAPGPDRIRPEHLKSLPPVLINTLARLFTRYLSECKVPKQWKTSKTVLLYKKGGSKDIDNYSPICLLSVIYKLFTRYKMLLCITSIDSKAFDTAEAEAVMEASENQDVPTPYINILCELHSNFMAKCSPFYDDVIIDVERKKRAVWEAYKSIEDVVKKTRNTRLCAHLFNTTVLPALTYASETRAFRKQEENAVSVTERAIERVILGVSRFTQVRDGIRSSLLRQRSKIRDAAAYAKESKIRWAGHVMRFNDNRWTRAVSDWVPRDIKRTTGRPSTRWSDFFTKSLKEKYDALRVPRKRRNHWATLARDQDKWKNYWRLLDQFEDQRESR